MRVLHIGKFFPPHAGGIERYSADLCAALATRDVEVMMLAHAPPGTHRNCRSQLAGVEVWLAACHGQWLYAPVSPGFPRLLSRAIEAFDPHLLHLHVPNTSAFWALLSPAARRQPWVVQWQSDIPIDVRRPAVRAMYALYRPFETALLRRAAAVIVASPAYRDSSPALAAWREKTHVVPLGLDAAPAIGAHETLPSLWPNRGLRLLAVGRLSYYKGFDILLRALALTPQIDLLLIGSGECAASLRALARELGIEARVRFAGHVDEATLARAYADADLFCLPSIERSEAFGMVLLEAMRARLPVVATAIQGSGVGYVVADGVTGTLATPGDAAALATALRDLANDAAKRAAFGAAGHARWAQHFTLQRCVQQTVDLYRSLLPATSDRSTAMPSR